MVVDDDMDWAVVDAIIQRKKVAIVISDDDGGTRRVGSCLSFASKLVSHDILFVLDKQYEYRHKLIEKFGFNCKCYNNQNDIFNILDEFNPQIVLNDVSDTSVEYMDELKSDKELPEDTRKRLEQEVQKVTDEFVKKIDDICAEKEKEIMTI